MTTELYDTQALKAQFDRAAHDPAYFGKLVLGKDVTLYPHQIEAIRNMGPALYDSQAPNVALMAPRQTGITTTLLIMAVWHAVFSPARTSLFLMKDSNAVKDFKNRINHIVKQLRWSLGITHQSYETLPGKILIKTPTLATIKSLKNEIVDAVYFDTLPPDQDIEFASKLVAAVQSLKSRVHILSSGYHCVLEQILHAKQLTGIPFVCFQVQPREMFSDTVLDELYQTLGEKEFLCQVVCANPRDVNAFAKFQQAL